MYVYNTEMRYMYSSFCNKDTYNNTKKAIFIQLRKYHNYNARESNGKICYVQTILLSRA